MVKCIFLFDFLLSTWLWAVTIGTCWLLFVPCISFILLYFWFKEQFLVSCMIPIIVAILAVTIHTLALFFLSSFYTPEELLFNQQHHMVNYLFYSTTRMMVLYLPLQMMILYCIYLIPLERFGIYISFSRQAYALMLSCIISSLLSYQFIQLGLISS